MNREVDTCPKCGALISKNLPRCRQCKTYLHGTQLEGFLLENLLPARLAAAPGTGVFFLLVIGYYALMVMFAGLDSAPGFSGFSTRQLGSTWSLAVWEGQYWRFVTSAFAHGGMIHLAFNLYALTVVGPLIEQLYDRKKMMLIYGVSGILSMAASHVVYVEILGRTFNSSVGASGAISGLIGACLIGAKRRGPEGAQVASLMLQWTAYMAIWGFAMDGIDNAAHASGWLLGAGLAALLPLGITQSVAGQRALSVVILGLLGVCLLSFGLMLVNLRGYPASLERDAFGRSMFFFSYADGTEWEHSSQYTLTQDCRDVLEGAARGVPITEAHLHTCELALRANPSSALYSLLAAMHDQAGNPERAEQLRRVLRRLGDAEL